MKVIQMCLMVTIIVFSRQSIEAQDTGSVFGSVFQKVSSDTVAVGGATVQIIDTAQDTVLFSVKTSESGKFIIQNVPQRTYKLKITNADGKSYTINQKLATPADTNKSILVKKKKTQIGKIFISEPK